MYKVIDNKLQKNLVSSDKHFFSFSNGKILLLSIRADNKRVSGLLSITDALTSTFNKTARYNQGVSALSLCMHPLSSTPLSLHNIETIETIETIDNYR